MIGLCLQVLAVLALVAGAAVILGNEVRLWIDDAHEQRTDEHAGRHRLAAVIAHETMREFLRAHQQRVTANLFAYADDALAAEADTVWLVRG